jgi:hypothetical protein
MNRSRARSIRRFRRTDLVARTADREVITTVSSDSVYVLSSTDFILVASAFDPVISAVAIEVINVIVPDQVVVAGAATGSMRYHRAAAITETEGDHED